MAFVKIRDHFTINNSPGLVIVFILIVYSATNFSHHNWTRDEGPDRGVIKWDVISYYGYLPATFIYGDPKLDFLDEGVIENDNKFWWSPTEGGKKILIMSCGLSIMYAPFFLVAHALATVFGEANDGFSSIYQFFLVFGALFYVALGFIFLKKILLRFFTPLVTALTMLVVGLGTNLFYYATYEAAMSHCHNFVLITIFFYHVLKWYDQPTWGRTFLLGFIFGLVVLIRPTNILIWMLLLLWGVDSWKSFSERVQFFLRNIPKVMLMIFAFGLPWIPQILYWHMVTGELLYYSYGPKGERFFFGNPHILESLFSYRKGWLLYTPAMAFALIGIIPMARKIRGSRLAVLVYMTLVIYVLSSWWSWWYGGSFGLRAYIDMYGILALPLAAFLAWMLESKNKLIRFGTLGIFSSLIILQLMQTRQYTTLAIHWDAMTKKAYWLNFMRIRPTSDIAHLLSHHDDQLCKNGIYVYYDMSEDWSELKTLSEPAGIELIKMEIERSRTLPGDIRRYARRMDISIPEATKETAERIYQMKRDHHFH